MDQNNISTLPEDERFLTIEERDKRIRDEITSYGFVRDCRLADRYCVPQRECIEYSICRGGVVFHQIPKRIKSLYLFVNEDKCDIFSCRVPGIDMLYPGRQFITINNPAENVHYDLRSMTKDPSFGGIKGKERVYCANSIISPDHFVAVRASIIDVIVFSSGFLRIDLINMACESVSFAASKFFDQCLDVRVDSGVRPGEVFFSGVHSGMVVHHPVLALALKNQAEIGVLDRNNGTLYARAAFLYLPDEYGNRFVDINKIQGESSHKRNLELFSVPA